jgi:hypothetical protein
VEHVLKAIGIGEVLRDLFVCTQAGAVPEYDDIKIFK